MSTDSTSNQTAAKAIGQDKPQQQDSVASAPAIGLAETLTEAIETIRMVEQALKPRVEPPYEAFFRACSNGDQDEAHKLLADGLIDVNHLAGGATALHIAASNGHVAIMQMLLDHGSDIDARLGLLKANNVSYVVELVGATPYILAKANRKEGAAAMLLAHGADLAASTDKGQTGQTILLHLRQVVPGLNSFSLTTR